MDCIGVLIITPAIVLWATREAGDKHTYRPLESAVFSIVLLGMSAYSLNLWPVPHLIHLSLLLIAPVLLWAAFRFSQRITFTAVFIVSGMVIIATVTGHGPFSEKGLNESLIELQSLLAVLATTMFVVSGMIVEHKLTDDALRESEEKYRMIFENSPLGITSFDQNGIIVSCNEYLSKILGAKREKVIGFNLKDCLKDEKMKSLVAETLAGKFAYNELDYLSITGGKLSSIKANFGPIVSEDGSLLGGYLYY